MIDGDLLTAYKPGSNKAGYITYTLSDKLDVKKFNMIQKGEISNAKVYALIDKEVTTRNVPEEDKEWVQLGTLRKSLNEFYIPHGNVYKLKFEWEENHIPTISEIIALTDGEYKSECAKDLKNYIDSLHVDEDKYTATSYKAYKNARDAALNAYNTQMGEKDALEEAKANLKTAYEGLTALGDLEALEAEIEALDNLSKDDYTEESYQALMAVKAEAEILLKKEDASVEEVDAMLEKLATAKAALVTKVSISKKTLRDYIDSNNLENLDTSIYLTSTVIPFKDALNKAVDILNEDATVTEVEDAYKALQDARKNLVLKATDTEVKALENRMASYKEEDYTASSWKDFELVLNEIKEELKAEHTSAEIEALTNKLEEASNKLVTRGNTAELELLLDQAKKTDSKLYTEKSYKNLLDVIETTEKALENKNELTQEEVDALTEDLRKAMEALEKLPVITPSIPEEKPTTPSKPEETTKPEVKPSTKPATGDTTLVGVFAFFSMISLLGYVLLKKKEA